MAYSNSSLVTYQRISPNRTSPRNHQIDRITPHCLVGQLSAPVIANLEMFTKYDTKNGASCNYAIGKNGDVALIVEEKDRSWCSSSSANDNRAVTIECASDKTHPYAIKSAVYDTLIKLCVDICRRNGKDTLLWFADKAKSLSYEPKANEMVLTVHRWFANKACPGDYIYNRLGKIAETVTATLGGNVQESVQDKYVVRLEFDKPITQTNSYNNLEYATQEADRYPGYSVYIAATGECVYTSPKEDAYTPQEWIAMIAPIATELGKKNQILPSVIIAQTCLETGFGKTDLTRVYNILGMKADLINNTWKEYSVWDGQTYEKKTPEYIDGQLVQVTARFRVYKTFRECVEDYEAFLLHVRNDKGLKYARLQGMTDPAKMIDILRIGTGTDLKPEGYFTDPYYKSKILELIGTYNLTQYDYVMDAVDGKETTVLGCLEKYQRQLDADKSNGILWTFAEDGYSSIFSNAVRDGNRKVGALTLINWALKELDVIKLHQFVSVNNNGVLECDELTLDNIKQKCDFIHVDGNSTLKQLKNTGILKPGDCILYQNQVMGEVYGGENIWFDSGRKNADADGKFITWECIRPVKNVKVAYIIRYGKISAYYRVQVGAYTSKGNAERRARNVKMETGFDCFVEKSDWYRVYCGSFKDETNAQRRVADLAERGVKDAIIRQVSES